MEGPLPLSKPFPVPEPFPDIFTIFIKSEIVKNFRINLKNYIRVCADAEVEAK